MTVQALFSVGQIIHHIKFDYRGVIVDVDAEYAGSEEWYEQVALSRPPKNKPWYHVLVDGSDSMTYVAERHLEVDSSGVPVQHPALHTFFSEFKDSTYQPRYKSN